MARIILLLLFVAILVALLAGWIDYQVILRVVIMDLIIPIALLGGWLLAGYLAYLPSSNPEHRISKWAGFALGTAMLGLMILLDVFGHGLDEIKKMDFSLWLIPSAAIGFATGLALMYAVSLRLENFLSSLLITALAGASLASLYLYFLIYALGKPLATFVVCLIAGALFYVVLFPSAIKRLVPKEEEPSEQKSHSEGRHQDSVAQKQK